MTCLQSLQLTPPLRATEVKEKQIIIETEENIWVQFTFGGPPKIKIRLPVLKLITFDGP